MVVEGDGEEMIGGLRSHIELAASWICRRTTGYLATSPSAVLIEERIQPTKNQLP